MGSWGTGLYDDDTACDARDAWLEKVRLGTPAEVATTELIAEWGGARDEPLFWLALADTQWKWGRLAPEVRERAEGVLAAGGDLQLWSASPAASRSARAKVFERLAAQLRKPPPAPRAIRIRSDAKAWQRGQLWAYRTLDGRYAVLRVAAFDPACGLVGAPVTELLDVVFDELPPSPSLADAAVRPARAGFMDRFQTIAPEHRASPMFEPKVKTRGELPRRRLKRLRAAGEPRTATPQTKCIGIAWSGFDQFLANAFDVGAPRLGAVHAWRTPSGQTRYTVVEWMEWTQIEPSWHLGVLDIRDETDSAKVALAPVLCSLIVDGFVPRDLNEVAFRPPTGPAQTVSGAVHAWPKVPALLDKPEALVAAGRAMKALFVKLSK
jgi:hypothetical protein